MNVNDRALEAAAKAIYDKDMGYRVNMSEAEAFAAAALEAAAPHIMAQALDVAADQLDTLWYLRKERMYEQRDWADGVEESETLIKKMAAGLRSAGVGE